MRMRTPCIVRGVARGAGRRRSPSIPRGITGFARVCLCSQRLASSGNRHLGVRVATGGGASEGARLVCVSAKDSKWMLLLDEFQHVSCRHASACFSRRLKCPGHRTYAARLERLVCRCQTVSSELKHGRLRQRSATCAFFSCSQFYTDVFSLTFGLKVPRGRAFLLGLALREGARAGLRTNLVDPASSHMLVSKIKPCMSQYKLLYGETANGSLKQL